MSDIISVLDNHITYGFQCCSDGTFVVITDSGQYWNDFHKNLSCKITYRVTSRTKLNSPFDVMMKNQALGFGHYGGNPDQIVIYNTARIPKSAQDTRKIASILKMLPVAEYIKFSLHWNCSFAFV